MFKKDDTSKITKIKSEAHPAYIHQSSQSEDAGQTDNPYAVPTANLEKNTVASTGFLLEPRKVRAGRGWSWITFGLRLFMKRPYLWSAIFFVFALLVSLGNIVPIVGSFATSLLSILFIGGMMIGAHALSRGDELRFDCLFSGFTQNCNQLLLVGVAYMIGMIVITIIAFLPMGAGLFQVFWGNQEGVNSILENGSFASIFLFILFAMALSIPLLMALCFAPCIVTLMGIDAVNSMKLSFRACLRNMLPWLVYGLGLFVFALIFFAIIGIFFALFSFLLSGSVFSILAMILPFLLICLISIPLGTIVLLSIYGAFMDVFSEQG